MRVLGSTGRGRGGKPGDKSHSIPDVRYNTPWRASNSLSFFRVCVITTAVVCCLLQHIDRCWLSVCSGHNHGKFRIRRHHKRRVFIGSSWTQTWHIEAQKSTNDKIDKWHMSGVSTFIPNESTALNKDCDEHKPSEWQTAQTPSQSFQGVIGYCYIKQTFFLIIKTPMGWNKKRAAFYHIAMK